MQRDGDRSAVDRAAVGTRRAGRSAAILAIVAAWAVLASLAPRVEAASSGDPRPESITLEPENISLIPGARAQLQAKLRYSDGAIFDVTTRMVYASSQARVGTVDAKGVVRALETGSSDLTAKDPITGLEARPKSKLKVAELRSITLTPATKIVRPGSRLALKAWGAYDNGVENVDLTEAVTWSSTKSDVATVGNETGKTTTQPKGLVVGIKKGRAVIEAEDPVSGVTSSGSEGELQVLESLSAVSVNPRTKVLRVNESTRFKVMGDFGGGVVSDVTNDIQFSISDPTVASIDPQGRVKALRTGTARVIARDRISGLTSTENAADGLVQVVGQLVSLKVTPTTAVVATADRVALRAAATYDTAGGSYNVSSKVTWRSSHPETVSVDRAGRATCIGEGTSTVSAVDPISGVTSTATGGDSTVRCAGTPISLRVSPATNVLAVGKSRQMKAYLGFSDGSEAEVTRNVIWSSTDDKVVAVEATGAKIGTATALKPGTATISAQTADGTLDSTDLGKSSLLRVPGEPLSVLIFPRPATTGGSLSGRVGTTFQLRARVQYDGGATQGINAEVTWTSSNPNVLSISNGEAGLAGMAQLKARGSVTVTIRYPKDGSSPTLTDSIRFSVN